MFLLFSLGMTSIDDRVGVEEENGQPDNITDMGNKISWWYNDLGKEYVFRVEETKGCGARTDVILESVDCIKICLQNNLDVV